MTKKRIAFEVDERLLAHLDDLADRRGVNRSELIKLALERHVEAERLRDVFASEDDVLREAAERFPDDKEAALQWVGRRRKELGLDQAW